MASIALSGASPFSRASTVARIAAVAPAAALIAIAALQFVQIFRRGINWDEFWHYSQIHELANGTLGRPLQTLHTRLFGWVVNLPGTGVDHVVVIRLFMFASEMVSTAAIAVVASRFVSRSTALLCALAYLTFPYVFKHGYSFRFDPPAAALLMSALAVITWTRLKPPAIAAAGVLLGIAPMVTIKIVLYAPAFAGLLWLRWTEDGRSRDYLARVAAIGGIAIVVFATIFALHSHGQVGDPGTQSRTIVAKAGSAMFAFKAMPYWNYALGAIPRAPITALLILAAPLLILKSARSPAERAALAGLLLPMTTLVFYHNTAPYFYSFMLPPVLVGSCLAMQWFATRFGPLFATGGLLAIGIATLVTDPPSTIDRQRELQKAADAMFPEPVHYFDFPGFLGKFPKANGFMTPVVVDIYRAGGMTPTHVVMQRKVVPLLMNNDPMFNRLFAGDDTPEFLPQDATALRTNYLRFAGPFWLAGKAVHPARGAVNEEFLVPGPYTVHDAPVVVDGRRYDPGDVVDITRGEHRIEAVGPVAVRLFWGNRLKPPAGAMSDEPFWTDF